MSHIDRRTTRSVSFGALYNKKFEKLFFGGTPDARWHEGKVIKKEHIRDRDGVFWLVRFYHEIEQNLMKNILFGWKNC